MRIAIITGSFLPIVGGLEWKVHYLATEYRKRGHDVVVFCQQLMHNLDDQMPITPTYDIIRVKLWRLPGLGKLGIASFMVSRRIILEHSQEKFDIIHCHHLALPTQQGVMVKLKTGLPVVATTCGGDIMMSHDIGFGIRLDPYYDRIVRSNLHRVDLVGCVSAAVRREVESLQPKARLVDLPNGVDWDRFQSVSSRWLRNRLSLPTDAVIIVSLGAHRGAKDYISGLRAFAKVVIADNNAHYVLIGRGTKSLQPVASELGLSGRVHFLDQVSMDEVSQVLHSADIFFSPSRSEGFPQVAAQALASALPCVLSDCPGNEDMRNCDGVVLARTGDADSMAENLIRLVNSRELRACMGQSAHKYGHRYGWSIIAERYLEIFQDLTVMRTTFS